MFTGLQFLYGCHPQPIFSYSEARKYDEAKVTLYWNTVHDSLGAGDCKIRLDGIYVPFDENNQLYFDSAILFLPNQEYETYGYSGIYQQIGDTVLVNLYNQSGMFNYWYKHSEKYVVESDTTIRLIQSYGFDKDIDYIFIQCNVNPDRVWLDKLKQKVWMYKKESAQ